MMSTSQPPSIVQSMSGGAGTTASASSGVVPEMLPQQIHTTSHELLYTEVHHEVQNNGTSHKDAGHDEQYVNGESGGNSNINSNGDSNNQEEGHTTEKEDAPEHDTSYEAAGGTEESDCSVEPTKLFVGQVPRSMEEADLFPVFEKYGPMEDVCIIRDKHTGQHRGCAFVTFFSKESAEACENELHNKFTLEGAKRPLQIKPAGRKLSKSI